jgi:hypothetical protein
MVAGGNKLDGIWFETRMQTVQTRIFGLLQLGGVVGWECYPHFVG